MSYVRLQEVPCPHAGCAFVSASRLNTHIPSSQAYFKRCVFKAAASGYTESSISGEYEGFAVVPNSPLKLGATDGDALALEDTSFELPDGITPVAITGTAEKAEALVYSDAPVKVFLWDYTTSPKETAVVDVGGNPPVFVCR
jgi:hypothetical protein